MAGPHQAPETHLPLLLVAEEAAAEAGEDVAGTVAEPLTHEVGGGRRCRRRRPVVDADVARVTATPGAAGTAAFRRQGDDGDAGGGQPGHGGVHLGDVRGLEDHPLGAAPGDPVQGGGQLPGRVRLAEVEAAAHHRRVQRGQFGLQCGPHGGGEAFRGLHHDVAHERAADQPDLGALTVQVGDGPAHLVRGALAHAAAAVEHPVDGGLAQARLPGDLPGSGRGVP